MWWRYRFSSTTLWRSRLSTKFNSQLPARPESIEAVLKVLSQNDELMVKDIARLGRLTQSQARVALEELVASGKVGVRKVQRPRKTLYRILPTCGSGVGKLFQFDKDDVEFRSPDIFNRMFLAFSKDRFSCLQLNVYSLTKSMTSFILSPQPLTNHV
jgi:hypothetical protein